MSKRAELNKRSLVVKIRCPNCDEERELELPIRPILKAIEKQLMVKINVK